MSGPASFEKKQAVAEDGFSYDERGKLLQTCKKNDGWQISVNAAKDSIQQNRTTLKEDAEDSLTLARLQLNPHWLLH